MIERSRDTYWCDVCERYEHVEAERIEHSVDGVRLAHANPRCVGCGREVL